MTNHTTHSFTVATLVCVAGVASLATLSGCRGDREDKPPRQFFPDMDDAPKWKPQTKSEFYADGRTMRQPVEGTVAFGRQSNVPQEDWGGNFVQQRDDLAKADPMTYEGRAADGTYLATIPATIKVDNDLLLLGKKKFDIYCSSCHGYDGNGKGMVGAQWSYPLPNFHDPKYITPSKDDPKSELWKDGYIFHTALYGVQEGAKMPGYKHALSAREAWAVVAYIRALQEIPASKTGSAGTQDSTKQIGGIQ
jgi:mono/diheme cytochrome c family protein